MADSSHLLPSFDPNKVTAAVLRGILLQHDVPYNGNAKKAELVKAFESGVRPQAAALLARMDNVRPTTEGILDGESQDGSLAELDTTSEEEERKLKVVKAKAKAKAVKAKGVKRVAGRKGKEVEQVEEEEDQLEEEEEKVAPVAKPRTTKVAASKVRKVAEHVNAEAGPVPVSPQKRRLPSVDPDDAHKRFKDDSSPAAPTENRRQSLKYESGGESGFSDFNPFQSAGEESPDAKLKARRRKSSMGPRRNVEPVATPSTASKMRQSLPNPPRISPRAVVPSPKSPEPQPQEDPQEDVEMAPPPRVEPIAKASPVASSSALSSSNVTPGVRYMIPVSNVKRSPPVVLDLQRKLALVRSADTDADDSAVEFEAERAVASDGVRRLQETPVKQPPPRKELRKTPAPKSRLSGAPRAIPISSATSPGRRPVPIRPVTIRPKPGPFSRFWNFLFFLGLLLYAGWWREEKVAAGFCDTSTTSNDLIRARVGSFVLPSWIPPPPSRILQLIDSLHLRPSCTTCPMHGDCRQGLFVTCAPDYVVSPAPFTLGGLLPLPPSCRPDTAKLMAVAMQASRISGILRTRKGEVVCGGTEKSRRAQGRGEVWTYGMSKGMLLANLGGEDEVSLEATDELVRLALADLELHDEIFIDIMEGEDWYAAQVADMTLACRARRALIRHVLQHKLEIFGLLTFIISIFWLRSYIYNRKIERERVQELVQTSLRQLRDQERLHHTDPVLAPSPHVAPSHLRDLVLQHEHSPARRKILWSAVEKVVEGNSNVRVKQVEQDGEEIRAWQFVGARVNWEGQKKQENVYPAL